MKQYILSVAMLFLMLLGLAWWWTINHPMSYFDQEYPMWKAKADLADTCQPWNVIFMGDSKVVAAVVPDLIGPGTVNLAVGGGRLTETLEMARKILACPTPPKAVILSITFQGLTENDGFSFWGRNMHFHLLGANAHELEKLRTLDRIGDKEFFGHETLMDFDARLKSLLMLARFPPYFYGSFIENSIYAMRKENKLFYRETYRERGHHFFGTADGDWEVDPMINMKHFKVNAFNDTLFDELISLFTQYHIPMYFIAMPTKESDIQTLNPVVAAEFESYIKKLEAQHDNFHFIGDYFPTLPNVYFADLRHLNPKGVDLWTPMLIQILNDNHISG